MNLIQQIKIKLLPKTLIMKIHKRLHIHTMNKLLRGRSRQIRRTDLGMKEEVVKHILSGATKEEEAASFEFCKSITKNDQQDLN